MHELALTKPIVDIAVEKATEAGADKVTKIVVIVGSVFVVSNSKGST